MRKIEVSDQHILRIRRFVAYCFFQDQYFEVRPNSVEIGQSYEIVD